MILALDMSAMLCTWGNGNYVKARDVGGQVKAITMILADRILAVGVDGKLSTLATLSADYAKALDVWEM
jgi:hypothetical protein